MDETRARHRHTPGAGGILDGVAVSEECAKMLEQAIGSGGMATVYLARDQRPTGRLNAWRTREASSLAKASLTGACPMIRRK
jgi:hypothetical protein